MRIVLDTNVLVSGLLNPEGAPGRIASLIPSGRFQLLYDLRILEEHRNVLRRPKFSFPQTRIDELLGLIELLGSAITAMPTAAQTKDPGDTKFLEVAISGTAKFLVTGNRRHFPASTGPPLVLSPVEFLTLLT